MTTIFNMIRIKGYDPKFILFNKVNKKERFVYITKIYNSDVLIIEEFDEYMLLSFPRKNIFGICDYIKISKDINEICKVLDACL